MKYYSDDMVNDPFGVAISDSDYLKVKLTPPQAALEMVNDATAVKAE